MCCPFVDERFPWRKGSVRRLFDGFWPAETSEPSKCELHTPRPKKMSRTPRPLHMVHWTLWDYERLDIHVGQFMRIADHDNKISNSGGMANFQEMVKLLLGL